MVQVEVTMRQGTLMITSVRIKVLEKASRPAQGGAEASHAASQANSPCPAIPQLEEEVPKFHWFQVPLVSQKALLKRRL